MNGARRITLRKQFQSFPIPSNQRFFLRTRPFLDLEFEGYGFLTCWRGVCVDEFYWQSLRHPTLRLRVLMRGNSCFQIVRVPRVIRAVSASEDVDVESQVGSSISFMVRRAHHERGKKPSNTRTLPKKLLGNRNPHGSARRFAKHRMSCVFERVEININFHIWLVETKSERNHEKCERKQKWNRSSTERVIK